MKVERGTVLQNIYAIILVIITYYDLLFSNYVSDKEILIPKYQNCECCEGFVYKCKGIACESMDSCYCKFTEEMNLNEFN